MPVAEGHGTFYWNELMTRDAEAAKTFYAQSLGWTYENFNQGMDYWVIMVDGKPAGGIFPANDVLPEGVPEHWMSYINVDDVDARLEKAKAAGASVLREPFDMPSVGRIAILKEPGGAPIGWITPAPQG